MYTCLNGYTEDILYTPPNCEALKILKFFKNRKRKHIFFKMSKSTQKIFVLLKFRKPDISSLFSFYQIFNPNSQLVVKEQIQVQHLAATTSSFPEDPSGTNRRDTMWRSIHKVALLILFTHYKRIELYDCWWGYEDMHASYQVSVLRETNRCSKALASTKVPGIHYGHLEAIASGWKLDLFLKGVTMDSESCEI